MYTVTGRPNVRVHLFLDYLLIIIIYLFITKGPTAHLQCYTKTQKYNKTQ